MLDRVLEPEVMDTEADAHDYDSMDHAAVNRAFVTDFLATQSTPPGRVLDVGTGTALIPVELCRRTEGAEVVAVDAAEAMIRTAARNVAAAGLAGRIRLEVGNGRGLAHPAGAFDAVVSNSIVHHLPDPGPVLAEMLRVCRPGGVVFVRDLLRPGSDAELVELVNLHAAGANPHQRQLFADSLRAALTLAEVHELLGTLGLSPDSARQTSDRHWTVSAVAS